MLSGAMLQVSGFAAHISIELATGRVLPTGGQGTARSTLFRVFRRERGDDFFEARIAAERVPVRVQTQPTIV